MPLTHRALPYPCPPNPRAGDFTDSSAGRARSYKEASAAATQPGRGAQLSAQSVTRSLARSLAYWVRQTRVWAGPEPEAAAPRSGACAASRVPGEQAAAAHRTGPPASASPSPPSQPPAHQYYASADGHRFPALTATSAAASPPLLRLRPAAAASSSAHLPAVGQRRHQPTSAGTRQWRPGRSVEVGAEGAHAAAAAAVS